jgi:hypothetical protein
MKVQASVLGERVGERLVRTLRAQLSALQRHTVELRARIASQGEGTKSEAIRRCYSTIHNDEAETLSNETLELRDPRSEHRSFVFRSDRCEEQLVTVREINFHAGGGGGFVW